MRLSLVLTEALQAADKCLHLLNEVAERRAGLAECAPVPAQRLGPRRERKGFSGGGCCAPAPPPQLPWQRHGGFHPQRLNQGLKRHAERLAGDSQGRAFVRVEDRCVKMRVSAGGVGAAEGGGQGDVFFPGNQL